MAKINEDDIDNLRESADIAESSPATRSQAFRRSTFKGLCPFHSEKTPSFTVDVAKDCSLLRLSQGGNVYKFISAGRAPSVSEASSGSRARPASVAYEESRPGEAHASGSRRSSEANKAAAQFFTTR